MAGGKNSKRTSRRRAPVIEALEPRILLSADLPGLDALANHSDDFHAVDVDQVLADANAVFAVTAPDPQVATDPDPEDEAPDDELNAVEPAEPLRQELVIVDPSVPDYQTLLANIEGTAGENRELHVVMLDPTQSGVDQITRLLFQYADLDAIHLISHGSDGTIQLGSDTLDAVSLDHKEDFVATWGAALGSEGDILIYGCNLAASESGEALVDALAELTGADVAASDDLTGHKDLGGDWDLEVTTGQVETAVAIGEGALRSWSNTLAGDITSDLVMHLPFDDAAGGTASDTTTYANDGTLSGVAVWTTGEIGGALKVDYSDGIDYVEVPNSATLENVQESDFTLASWFRPDSTPPGSGSDADASYGILIKEGWHTGLYYGSDNRFYFTHVLTGDQGEEVVSTNTYAPGQFYHVAGVLDRAAGTMEIYVDGVLQGTNSFTPGTAAREYGTETWTLGVANPSGGIWAWTADGAIDDARIYSRALTSDDVGELVGLAPALNTIEVTTTSDANDAGIADGNLSQDIDWLTSNQGADGKISLREAIIAANNTPNGASPDEIHFNISTADAGYVDPDAIPANGDEYWSIATGITSFNQIDDAVVIDGSTQPGFAGKPIIEIDGSGSASNDGFHLAAGSDGSTIRGLAINNFDTDGIDINGSDGNIIQGNYIGTNIAGDTAAGNTTTGINIRGTSSNNLIGGSAGGQANLVGGNGTGILISASGTDGNKIIGNFIGTDLSGTIDLGNGVAGIRISGLANNNTIGGTGAGEGNVVAFNDNDGLQFQNGSGVGNSILGNTIYSNAQMGIDLHISGRDLNDPGDPDSGANNRQNYPVIASAVTNGVGSITVAGTLDTDGLNQDYRIEFFASTTADPTGYGEAERFLGAITVTTDGSGDATFSAPIAAVVAAGEFITATATVDNGGGGYGDTSEFALNTVATTGQLVVDTTSDDNDAGIVDGNLSHDISWLIGNRGGDGKISLREAIIAANNTSGADTISFDITGAGPHVISLAGALPSITDTLLIDGSSEPDYVANTPVVRVDGASAGGGVSGFTFASASDGSTLRGLMITRFTGDGVLVQAGADNITIAGNWIGTSGTGSIGVGNADDGIDLRGAGAIIGGTGPDDRNVITDSGDEGIDIVGTGITGHQILGNYIGVDPDGSTGNGNADVGIAIISGSGNTIGGTTAAARNVISMNVEGIEINTSNNVVQGNYIGVDAGGTVDRGNRSDDGVEIQGASTGNVIGGAVAGAGNVISGNALNGVRVGGGSGHTIAGNLIGTDATGTIDLGNAGAGINLFNTSNIVIGGTTPAERNVISGNVDGIYAQNADGTSIQGNYIGTDATGLLALGNSDRGVQLESGANNTTVGGTTAGAGNVVSGNANDGIIISDGASPGTGTTGTVIQGNYIGVGSDGVTALGNATDGIRITTESGHTIGGTAAGAGNVIAHNLRDGVQLQNSSAVDNPILGNSIYANIGEGIDLAGDGVTANDTGDGDSGANGLQNYPVITQAQLSGTDLTLSGTLDTDGLAMQYRIEFFGNAAGTQDASNGEGRVYLGSTTITTDGSGDGVFTGVTLTGVTLNTGDYVTATATRIDNPAQVGLDDALAYGDTSEFAQNIAVTGGNQPPGGSGALTTTTLNDNAGATNLFGLLSVSDPDVGESDLVLRIILSDPTAGSIAGGGFSETGPGTGIFTATGLTVAQANTALDNVTFTPTDNSGPSGSFNTDIGVDVDDGEAGFQPVLAATTLTINRIDDAPSITDNTLTISEGGGVTFSAVELASSDPDTPDSALTFTVSNLTGGTFQRLSTGATLTSFTQADVIAGDVFFRHDGGEAAPSYDVSVSDGTTNVGPQAAAIVFTNVNDGPVNNLTGLPQSIASSSADGATAVFAADLDSDGDIDLVSSSWTDDRVAWYQNDGTGSFTEFTIATGVSGARHVFVADIDGDTHLDVIASDYENDTVTWYRNNGAATPTFAANTVTNTADGAWSSFAIDMDGDGDTDILSASIWDDKIAWYENDGAPTPGFTEHVITTNADGARTVVAGDLDGDGDIDVASASYIDDTIAWYQSDGAATPGFTEHVVSTGALGAMSITIGDVDADGNQDLITASYADGKIAWFENDGAVTPTFSENVISTSAAGARDVFVADMDGDGDLDVLSASFVDDKFAWYENDGAASPTFTERLVSQDGDGPRSVVAA
ncbi:MAG: DUF4347 domain-containing protein, partial [Sedimenticolaceae bacterium]